MKQLLIIGARGFGREVYGLAKACIDAGADIEVKGFLDDSPEVLEGYRGYPPIVSPVESYEVQEEDVFICALGEVSYKKKYASIIQERGGNFISLIHPSASIGLNTVIGKGCIVEKQSIVSCDVILGDFVTIMPAALLGHDVKVGDWSHVGSLAFIGGFSILGDSVTLNTHSTVVPKLAIGDNAVINANTLVIRNVAGYSVMMGNPAREMFVPKRI